MRVIYWILVILITNFDQNYCKTVKYNKSEMNRRCVYKEQKMPINQQGLIDE